MILNGDEGEADELGWTAPSWLKDVGSEAAGAAAGKAGQLIRDSGKKKDAPPPPGAPDNTVRNVALAGGGIVLAIILVSKLMGGRKTA